MMRALYETNKLAKYPIIAEIYMTGLAIPASFRGDLNNRVLEFPFLKYEQDGKAETQRHEEFLAMRVPLLSETIARLQLVLKGEREEAKLGKVYKTTFRVKDFGLFLKRQAHFGGFENEMEAILDEVVQTQEQRTSEKSTVYPTLTLLVGKYHSVYGHERMNSTRLCAVLTDMAKHLKTKFFYEDNPIGLGMFISENVELLEKKYGLVRKEYGGHMSFRFELTDSHIAALRADLELFGVRADTPAVC